MRGRLAIALILVAGLVVWILSGGFEPEPPAGDPEGSRPRTGADSTPGPDAAVPAAEVRPAGPASRLRVSVRDPGGAPLADVSVRVLALLRPRTNPMTAVTGVSGDAEFTLDAGAYRLRATAPGQRSVATAVTLRGEDVEIALTLAPASFVAIRVVDEGDRPVPGALVRIGSDRIPGPGRAEGEDLRAGANGIARVPLGAWWPPLQVAAWSPDLVRSGSLEIGTPPGREPRTLVVRPDPALRIRLRDVNSGDPLSGKLHIFLGSSRICSADVSPDGLVLGRPGSVARLRVVAHAADHADAVRSFAQRTAVLDVWMTPRARAVEVAFLVHGPDGEPLPGVHVWLARFGPGESGTAREAITDAAGRARLALPAVVGQAGSRSFWGMLGKPGHATETIQVVVYERDDREIIEVERTLQAAATVTAEVRSGTGEPMAGVRVFATQEDGRSAVLRLSRANRQRNPVTTDSRGLAVFADLRSDRAVDLLALDDEGGVASASLPAGRERDARVTLRLARREPLVISVTDGEQPIPGATIGIVLSAIPGGPGRQALGEALLARTDARGNAIVTGLPEGPCRIVATHPGYHVLRRGLAAGARRAEVALEERVSISGRVEPLDATVVGARVRARETRTSSGSSVTIEGEVREDGSFEIEGLRRGVNYSISFASEAEHHHGNGWARAVAPAEGVVLPVTTTPAETARIRLEVRGAKVRSGLGSIRLHHVDTEGRHRTFIRAAFLAAPDGPGEKNLRRADVVVPRVVGLLEIDVSPFWPEMRIVDLAAAPGQTIAIRPTRRTATFRVVDADGAPQIARIEVCGTPKVSVPGSHGAAGPLLWRGRSSASTGRDGLAEVTLPPDGAWFATVRAGGETHRRESSDRPDAEGRYVIRLTRKLPRGR